MTTLREVVAETLYNGATVWTDNRPKFRDLSDDRKAGWLEAADLVIPLVEKFSIAERFKCPLGRGDCVADCGSYGCGN